MAALARPVVERLPSSSRRVSLEYKAKRFVRAAARPPLERHHGWKEIFSAEARAALLEPARRAPGFDPLSEWRARFAETAGAEPLARLQDVDIGTYLVDDLLVKTDRASMAHSLEVRVPFLDPVVADLAFALPTSQKVLALAKKRLLRRAAAGLVPRAIVHGPKRGFSIPAAAWLRGELRPFARDVLSPDALRRDGFFRPAEVTRLLDEHESGREDHSRALWGAALLPAVARATAVGRHGLGLGVGGAPLGRRLGRGASRTARRREEGARARAGLVAMRVGPRGGAIRIPSEARTARCELSPAWADAHRANPHHARPRGAARQEARSPSRRPRALRSPAPTPERSAACPRRLPERPSPDAATRTHRRARGQLRVQRVAVGDRGDPLGQLVAPSSRSAGVSAVAMMSATSAKSSSPQPRVARAGVPMRRPDVTIGGRGSNGTALRFTVMPTSCSRSSACLPSSSESRRSTSTRWTSVPPVSTVTPAAPRPSQQPVGEDLRAGEGPLAGARGTSGSAASLKRHRLGRDHVLERAALLAGEHGRVDLLRELRRWHRMTPPRGPPSVLCVVVVTTWACGTGVGCRPAATRPAKCAMSTIR